jgi:hypothetical protein
MEGNSKEATNSIIKTPKKKHSTDQLTFKSLEWKQKSWREMKRNAIFEVANERRR